MATLQVFDPTGSIDVQQPHAARLPTLAGKRIGFLTNEQWQAYFALPLLKSTLERDFPDAEVLAIDALPKGNDRIGSSETARIVRERGIEAVIIGNAA
jgi:hypothetical protein